MSEVPTAELPESGGQARLKVAGAFSGYVEALLDEWGVEELQAEISRVSGLAPESFSVICAGRTLRAQGGASSSTSSQGKRTLRACGVGPNAKLLLTGTTASPAAQQLREHEKQAERLSRLKAAADAMAQRMGTDAFPSEGPEIRLENQRGEAFEFENEQDRRALMMGLMLHAKARGLIQRANYKEALGVLELAEEAFSLSNPKYLAGVDNVGLLEIDTVWCLYNVRDAAALSAARVRLARARQLLRRSHGPGLERMRRLQGDFCPELAVYLRLELLEGVAAFHSGDLSTARQHLAAASSLHQRLQVTDEALAALASMGFQARESRRALRAAGQNVERAVTYVMEMRRRRQEAERGDRERDRMRREQKRIGRTASGKAVDITKVKQLAELGYGRVMAGEALRQAENDFPAALDNLTNPEKSTAIQVAITLRSSRKRARGPPSDRAIAEVVAMGFDEAQARRALEACNHSILEAVDKLLRGQFLSAGTSAQRGTSEAGPSSQGSQDGPSGSSRAHREGAGSGEGEDRGGSAGPSGGGATEDDEDDQSDGNDDGSQDRDIEMEEEISNDVHKDPDAEYDVDVNKEGEAITEYLALLASTSTQ